ncbi:hypothetical protein [Sphingomonas sp.]|jgi:hypothetical protein|uniref:hypothetical protein n=1 Tax=Sphingomonas sp. TaxID=28214 RepID=UPI003561C7BF
MSHQFTPEQLAFGARLYKEFPFYAANCLKVRTKQGEIKPFILNAPQLLLHKRAEDQMEKRGFVRLIACKARQQGISTYIAGRSYHKTSHRKGYQSYILTHLQESTDNLFSMTERFHENCPLEVRPQTGASNAKELNFKLLDSGTGVGTAGSKGVGRGKTLQFVHSSEVAYQPNAETHSAGLLQAVPQGEMGRDTEIWMESTADGIGNYFHSTWSRAVAGENDFEPIFIPWYMTDEYRQAPIERFKLDDDELEYQAMHKLDMAQMMWRRKKIGDMGDQLFKREYPASVLEAFSTTGGRAFMPMTLVERAMNAKADPFGAVVFGVDPARFGEDRTALCVREGRVCHWVKSWNGLDTMDIVGTVKRYAAIYNPKAIFVDVVGLGAGVYDRMRELGMPARAVNGGEKPNRPDKYYNKRAEMWGEAREWLKDGPCKIPKDEALAADLCGLQYKFDSKSRYVLEKKEDAKARGVRSPDLADAFCLTFAEPVALWSVNSFEPGAAHNPMGGESFEPEVA